MTADRQEYIRLEQGLRGRICIRCGSEPRMAYIDQEHQPRCNCYPDTPVLSTKRSKNLNLAKREGELMQERDGVTLVPAEAPAEIDLFRARKQALDEAIAVFEEGVHFGKPFPSSKDKALYEAGAEMLRARFNILWDAELIERFEDFDNNEFRYTYAAKALSANGVPMARWEATASSKEPKFKGMNPADLPNNVRDRAQKRAFVNLIKNVTGASALFKVPLDATEPVQAPPRKPDAPKKPGPSKPLSKLSEDAKLFLGWCESTFRKDADAVIAALEIKSAQAFNALDFEKAGEKLKELWGKKTDLQGLFPEDEA